MKALKNQVGGEHYKDYAIQPIEFIYFNNIPFLEANVIKYIVRWKEKNGVQDLEKAKHYICLLYTSPSPRDGLLSRMPSSA